MGCTKGIFAGWDSKTVEMPFDCSTKTATMNREAQVEWGSCQAWVAGGCYSTKHSGQSQCRCGKKESPSEGQQSNSAASQETSTFSQGSGITGKVPRAQAL